MVSLISIKYEQFYLLLSFLAHSLMFKVLLGISNNSIKHQSFVYTQLNDQTILFQIIQFCTSTKLNGSKYFYVSSTIQTDISHLFTHSTKIK